MALSHYDAQGKLKQGHGTITGGLLDSLYGVNPQSRLRQVTATTTKPREVVDREPAPTHYEGF